MLKENLTDIHKYGIDNVILHSGEPALVAVWRVREFSSYLRKMKWMALVYYHSMKVIINNSWQSNLIRSVVCSFPISSHQCTKLRGNWPSYHCSFSLKICWLLVDRENYIIAIPYPSHYHPVCAKRLFYIGSGLRPWMKMKRNFIDPVKYLCF